METYFLNLLAVFIQYICMFELAFKYTKQSILKYRLKILAALPLILLSATLQFLLPMTFPVRLSAYVL